MRWQCPWTYFHRHAVVEPTRYRYVHISRQVGKRHGRKLKIPTSRYSYSKIIYVGASRIPNPYLQYVYVCTGIYLVCRWMLSLSTLSGIENRDIIDVCICSRQGRRKVSIYVILGYLSQLMYAYVGTTLNIKSQQGQQGKLKLPMYPWMSTDIYKCIPAMCNRYICTIH